MVLEDALWEEKMNTSTHEINWLSGVLESTVMNLSCVWDLLVQPCTLSIWTVCFNSDLVGGGHSYMVA